MRKLLTNLPTTRNITDPGTRKHADLLNIELDGMQRDLNKYVSKVVYSTYDSDGTLTADDELVLASGTITLTFPPVASSLGKVFYIKNIGTGVVTCDGNGATIDGEDTIVLSNQYDFIVIVSNASVWHIVADMAMGRDRFWTGTHKFSDGEFIVLDKASGNGIKIDTTTPTFGWRDLEGFEIPDPTGGDRPTLSTYSGGSIKENAFSNGDVLRIRYHIPHDYVKGTDIFSHIHWSHNGTAISGNVVFGVTSDYSKGHNQTNFGTEKSISITYATTDISTTPRYRHRIEESAITNAGGSATLIDRGLLEPDGIILVTFELTANPTITGGSPNNVFVHRADLHYQSTNIATKEKEPDFYA